MRTVDELTDQEFLRDLASTATQRDAKRLRDVANRLDELMAALVPSRAIVFPPRPVKRFQQDGQNTGITS